VSSASLVIELDACVAMQSWVNSEYRRGLNMHHCGAPVLRISKVEVLVPTFTTCWWGSDPGPELNDKLGGYYCV
jgi:hypothetical protein